jgi:malonyl-CoA/methylmalonyl-CoA synthetase
MSNVDIPLIARAREHVERTAIMATEGVFTYGDLLDASGQVATCILDNADDLHISQRVAFLIPPGFQYTATQWGIWRAGGVAVPLCVSPRNVARKLPL